METKKLLLIGNDTASQAESLTKRGYEITSSVPAEVSTDGAAKEIYGVHGVLLHFDDHMLAEEIALKNFLYPPVLVYGSRWPANGRLQREVEAGMACPYWLTTEDPSETDIVDVFLETADMNARKFLACLSYTERVEKE